VAAADFTQYNATKKSRAPFYEILFRPKIFQTIFAIKIDPKITYLCIQIYLTVLKIFLAFTCGANIGMYGLCTYLQNRMFTNLYFTLFKFYPYILAETDSQNRLQETNKKWHN
jgi:hypothetical protein